MDTARIVVEKGGIKGTSLKEEFSFLRGHEVSFEFWPRLGFQCHWAPFV